MRIKASDKGSSLYFSLVVMTIVLGIALGVSAVLISQIKVARGMGNSVVALYAADTGVEHALKVIRVDKQEDETIEDLEARGLLPADGTISFNGESASYEAVVSPPGVDCSGQNFCIRSVGEYGKVKRAIEIDF